MFNAVHFFAAGLFGVLALFQPTEADALYKKVLPWQCYPKDTASSTLSFDSAGIYQATAVAGQTPTAFCPYPSDPDLPHGSVSSIDVNVVDATTGAGSVFSVKACVMRTSPDTLYCGTPSSNPSASAGDYTISVSPSVWNAGAASTFVPYVNVTFPDTTTVYSELRGILVQ